ncbi:MAG: helix-turn-helix domain-containing protein [Bacteroidota bacterium]
MESNPLFSILGIGLSFMGLFISLYYVISKKCIEDGYFWLYTIIFLLGLELGHKTFLLSRMYEQLPFLYSPGRYYNLMLYPALLFLVWSIMGYNPIKKNWQAVIFLLFSFTGVKRLRIILTTATSDKVYILERFYADSRPGPHDYWMNLTTSSKSTIIPIVMLVTIVFSYLLLLRRQQNKPNKRLVLILLGVISLYIVFSLSSNFLYQYLYQTTTVSLIEWPVDIVFLSLVTTLLVCIALMVNSGSKFFPPIKYKSSALNEKRYPVLFSQIEGLIESEKLYLNQNLTIKNVADRLVINSKYISQVLNHYKNMSFIEFVNQHRVEEAKKLINSPASKSLTLEAIGNSAGFHSKSSFIKAFKKFVGKTPGQYLKG